MPFRRPGPALRHKNCGSRLTLAVLEGDVAIYVWCDTCHDLVEFGELLGVDFPQDNDGTVTFNQRRWLLREMK